MAKPLDEFGGWLFYFYIMRIISLICTVILLLLIFTQVLFLSDINQIALLERLMSSVYYIIYFFITFNILRNIKIKLNITPHKIVNYLKTLLIITLIALPIEFIITYLINDKTMTPAGFNIIFNFLLFVAFCLIWIEYFKYSDRVELFYGIKTFQELERELDFSEDLHGNSTLMQNASNGNLKKVIELIKKGLDINKKNNLGLTPLMSAVKRENAEVIKLLLKHNADIKIKDNKNMTALDYAYESKNNDIIDLLKKTKKR